MNKKGNAYSTSQSKAKGVFRVAHHSRHEEETKELLACQSTAYMSTASGFAESNSKFVLQIACKSKVPLGLYLDTWQQMGWKYAKQGAASARS